MTGCCPENEDHCHSKQNVPQSLQSPTFLKSFARSPNYKGVHERGRHLRKQSPAAYLQKHLALLELARCKADSIKIYWCSMDIGSWNLVRPSWCVSGENIQFRFYSVQKVWTLSVISVRLMPWGIRIALCDPVHPLQDVLEMRWQESDGRAATDFHQLWNLSRHWLCREFPMHQIIKLTRRTDRTRSLSCQFLRVLFRCGGKGYLLIAADHNSIDSVSSIISQALLSLFAETAKRLPGNAPIILVLVPSEVSPMIGHRCRHLNPNRVRIEVWGYRQTHSDNLEVCRARKMSIPEENKDFRWPVLGPFHWSSILQKVLDLAPHLIRRYPRFHDYDSLRLWGLEFAQVRGVERDRVCFGIGASRVELTSNNFDALKALILEILYYRRADSPDTQHPYYRLYAERWLEALILEDVSRIFPELVPESVYSQIPVYLGRNPGRIDVLGANHQGRLVVMELKVSPDPDLPLQALDYWGRVIEHSRNGDFERRGYFSEVCLSRDHPLIYLVAPVFSFHDTTELLLDYLNPDMQITKVSINEDWRRGVKIVRRTQCDLKKPGKRE